MRSRRSARRGCPPGHRRTSSTRRPGTRAPVVAAGTCPPPASAAWLGSCRTAPLVSCAPRCVTPDLSGYSAGIARPGLPADEHQLGLLADLPRADLDALPAGGEDDGAAAGIGAAAD